MAFLFINIGGLEMSLIFFIAILFFILIGNYGKDTILGYWGSVVLSLIATPIISVFVIYFLRKQKATQ